MTMHSIELIRENLRKSRDRVLARIEHMREHCVVFPTRNGGCHTLWVLGHLAYIEALVTCTFMLGEANPLVDWEERRTRHSSGSSGRTRGGTPGSPGSRSAGSFAHTDVRWGAFMKKMGFDG